MQRIKVRRGTFQHIEAELYAYHETKKEIVRLREEILHGKSRSDENIGGGRSNLPGDPTGRTAIALVSHRRLQRLEEIVDAIEGVYSRLPDEKKRLIEIRYWTKPRILTWDGIAREIPTGRATVFRWRDEIIFAIAEELGWR